MSAAAIVLFISLIVVVDGLILFVLVPRVVKAAWEPIGGRFPPVEPAPNAVRREFQSFKIGLLNLGWSVHVAVDEEHLHLFPAWLPRVWGMTAASVPWPEITDKGPSLFGQRKVRVRQTVLIGPAWCLELACADGARA